ncbi:hypothetical protein RhiirA5_425669 [Rhizophagus irregularis]|uniref:Uncharacterized protein n=1 Tax=Rhizophagus irregularis TaxID=588596 RepID=A0A2N0R9C3_9GLOM|nr:hypothetical protein RhiirA5_425669 [Rhizophagus irregularis]PKC59904.1 hypothetical protein RhiirA1_468790 [Rhizophagus irregularis]
MTGHNRLMTVTVAIPIKEPLRVLEKYPSLGKPKTLNKDLDPFKSENWVSVRELVLNNEPSEEKYITPSLAKYPTMHKRAGAREVKRPYEMHVKLHDLSSNIDDAIRSLGIRPSIYDEAEYMDYEYDNLREEARDIFERYKELLKLANNYN